MLALCPTPALRSGLPEGLVGREAARLLQQLGLAEHADRACGSYSGGMRRKLSVAVALAGGAQVLARRCLDLRRCAVLRCAVLAADPGTAMQCSRLHTHSCAPMHAHLVSAGGPPG